MKKPKLKLPGLVTRAEAEAAMNDLAAFTNRKRSLTADLDAAILKLQESAAPAIGTCENEISDCVDALQQWAEAHPEEFPNNKKSIAFLSGTLGFRTGTPKLALLSRAWNWDKVLIGVQQLLPNFIRSRPEVDREALLNQRDDEGLKYALPRVGLKVVQDESFFVEPKLSKPDAKP